jgi:hypothetical protein
LAMGGSGAKASRPPKLRRAEEAGAAECGRARGEEISA